MSFLMNGAKLIDLKTILESQQRSIDLRLKDFEVPTFKFLKAVQAYSNRAKEEITSRKNNHVQELKRLSEKKMQEDAETTACKVREIQLVEVLEREQGERRDAESSAMELKRQFASVKEKCASADKEINYYKDESRGLQQDKRKDMELLSLCSSKKLPELQGCEAKLRCILEGIGSDRLLCRFLLPHQSTSREFSIVIDVSTGQYKVPVSTPPLPIIPLLVDQLNGSRDFYQFVKAVRNVFLTLAGEA